MLLYSAQVKHRTLGRLAGELLRDLKCFDSRGQAHGTGLGLAIARQIVFAHGGAIELGRSDLGGALFTVALPAS